MSLITHAVAPSWQISTEVFNMTGTVGIIGSVRLLSDQIRPEGCTHPGKLTQEYPRHL